jgi:hypothetical protein
VKQKGPDAPEHARRARCHAADTSQRPCPAVNSVGPASRRQLHLPHRSLETARRPRFSLLSPLPSAKPVDTRRLSPPRELDAVRAGREKSTTPSTRRITVVVIYSCRAASRARPSSTYAASRLAATRRAAMRRCCGRRGRRWPTTARASLSIPEGAWTLLQAVPSIKGNPGAPARLPLSVVRHCAAAMELTRPSFVVAG